MPTHFDRDYEDRLVRRAMSGTLDSEQWANCGPPFFMAGLAVMMASDGGRDRRGLLELAEQRHQGASEVGMFQRWLSEGSVKPSRSLPLLDACRQKP